MGQFLIVQGENPEQVADVFRLGVDAFERLSRLRACDRLDGRNTAVAVFPRLANSRSAGIVRRENDWICGAGSWFYEGHTEAEGLRRLTAGWDDNSPLDALDGQFAIVMAGREPGELRVVTDRLGTIHVYRAHWRGCVLISTSSLILAALVRPEWDPEGLRQFLVTGSIYESSTLFRGIEKLPPAGVFVFRHQELHASRKYWDVANVLFDKSPIQGDAAGLAGALRETVSVIGARYPRALLDLTGGFDSRAVLGAVLQAGLRFDTVVIGPPADADVVAANRIAAEFQLRHSNRQTAWSSPEALWLRVRESVALCDGEFNAVLYAPILENHSKQAEGYEATINGSNGEICKGYWWELLFPHIGERGHFDARAIAAARFVPGGEPRLLAYEFSQSLVDNFADIIRRANASLKDHPNTAQLDNVYLTLRMQRWQGRIASATDRIWPGVMPFGFRKPMEMALSAPPPARLRHRMSRRLIEHQNRKLASLPLAQGYPALPLRWNTAHRFWPLAAEVASKVAKRLRRKLGLAAPASLPKGASPMQQLWQLEEVREMLNPTAMQSREVYDPAQLRQQTDRFAQDPASLEGELAGRMLTVELAARAIRG